MTIEQMTQLVGGAPIVSEWFLVDQDRIDRFADATGDHQFIHVDPARAAAGPFGGTVAHGLLVLSLVPDLAARTLPPVDGTRMVVNYGYDKVRFVSPVPAGSRIRAAFATRAFEQTEKGRWKHSLDVTVEIEGAAKPAMVARSIGMLFF